jgi:hypothetical protein
VVLVLLLTSTVLGRAKATIMELKANILITKSIGFNLGRMEPFTLKPFKELTFKVAVCLFLFQTYQAIATGKRVNNQKN